MIFSLLVSLTALATVPTGMSSEMLRALNHPLELKGVRRIETMIAGDDYPLGSATDSSANVYVVGYTEGTFSGQTALGSSDCFLAKFNSSGVLQWARQFGSSSADVCTGVALDTAATPSIFVVGYTSGTISGETSAGGIDAFVTEYTNAGTQSWLTQFGTNKDDYAYGVASDTSNRPYIAGSTRGSLTGFTNLGSLDAFLASYNSSGAFRWYQQFGTVKEDESLAVSRDSSNRFFPVGYTQGALPGNTIVGSLDAWVARYSTAGVQSWIKQFGTVESDLAIGVSATTAGITNIVGATSGAFSGFSNAGGDDYFFARYSVAGVQSFVKQAGTAEDEMATSVCGDSTGNPTFGGRTNGAFSGYSNAGGSDIFITEYTTAGVLTWRTQTGSTGDDGLNGISCTTAGINHPVGQVDGAYSGEVQLGAEDAVVFKYSSAGAQTWITQFGTP